MNNGSDFTPGRKKFTYIGIYSTAWQDVKYGILRRRDPYTLRCVQSINTLPYLVLDSSDLTQDLASLPQGDFSR